MKKRIVLILGLSVFMLLSASCGGAKESPAAAAETVPEAPEKADKDAGEEKKETVNNVEAPFIKAMELYKDTMSGLPKDSYFAFVDMDEKHDALLVASKDDLFGEDQKLLGLSATVYAPDKDGNIKEYGMVESGGTAYPFVANKGKLYYGNHTQLISVYIDEEKSEMIETVEAEVAEDADDKAYEEFSESFSAYDEGAEIYFSPVSMALQE